MTPTLDSIPPIEPMPAAGPPTLAGGTTAGTVPGALAPPVPAPPAYPMPPQYQTNAQYPYTPQAGQPYSPYYPEATFNTLAIVGFVLAFFVSIGAVVCGHIALSQIKRTGERGHGLALAAVIIGYAGVAVGILYVIFVIVIVAVTASTSSY